MPRRKRDNATPPPGPAKPEHPVLAWLERERREHEREQARKRKRLKAAFPWFRELPTVSFDGMSAVSLGFVDPNAPPLSPAEERELIQRRLRELVPGQEMAERENAQMRLMLEQQLEVRERDQERQRQTRQIWKLERKLERQTQEFQQLFGEIRAAIEKAIAGIDTQANMIRAQTLAELGSRGRKKRAENYEAEPWRVYTRAAAIEATKADPTLSDAELGRKLPKLVAGPDGRVIIDPDDKVIVIRADGERIEWPHPRTVYRFFHKLRNEKTLPPPPPRKRK
jgi:hypothetical protein